MNLMSLLAGLLGELAAVPPVNSVRAIRDGKAFESVFPKTSVDGSRVVEVVLTHHLLDGLGRFLCVVVRHGVEEMVGHVGVADVMPDDVPGTVVAVNGGQSSTKPVPGGCVVVRHILVGVLESSDGHQARVGHNQGQSVNPEHPGERRHLGELVQDQTPGQQTGITQQHQIAFLLREKRAIRPEVRDEIRGRMRGDV